MNDLEEFLKTYKEHHHKAIEIIVPLKKADVVFDIVKRALPNYDSSHSQTCARGKYYSLEMYRGIYREIRVEIFGMDEWYQQNYKRRLDTIIVDSSFKNNRMFNLHLKDCAELIYPPSKEDSMSKYWSVNPIVWLDSENWSFLLPNT